MAYIPEDMRQRVLRRDGFLCRYWGISPVCTAIATQVDHIHPESRGGPTTDQNLQATCGPCNNTKNDMNDAEFRSFLRFSQQPPPPPPIYGQWFGQERSSALSYLASGSTKVPP